jgi:hypothetical protein
MHGAYYQLFKLNQQKHKLFVSTQVYCHRNVCRGDSIYLQTVCAFVGLI